MFPEELYDIISNKNPEELSILLLQIDNQNKELLIKIQVSTVGYDDQEVFSQEYSIKTVNYRSSRVSFENASSLEILTEDPLLWYYSDRQSSLYFNGACQNKEKLYFDLHEIHRSLFQGNLDFEDSLNNIIQFDRLIESQNGLLASGPTKLLKSYGVVLDKHNMNYSIVGDHFPKYWDGEQNITESGNAKVLFIDDSYIIADEFIFIK